MRPKKKLSHPTLTYIISKLQFFEDEIFVTYENMNTKEARKTYFKWVNIIFFRANASEKSHRH